MRITDTLVAQLKGFLQEPDVNLLMQGPKLPFCPWDICEFFQPLQVTLKRCHRCVGVGLIRAAGLCDALETPHCLIQQADCLELLTSYFAHLASSLSGVAMVASRRPPALPRSAGRAGLRDARQSISQQIDGVARVEQRHEPTSQGEDNGYTWLGAQIARPGFCVHRQRLYWAIRKLFPAVRSTLFQRPRPNRPRSWIETTSAFGQNATEKITASYINNPMGPYSTSNLSGLVPINALPVSLVRLWGTVIGGGSCGCRFRPKTGKPASEAAQRP